MNQEEKIYQKIKNASNKDEENSFPGMDKVWNRVEEKLDTKIIKKKSEIWKKLAIAASFLLFFTVGTQLFITQKELTTPIETKIKKEQISEEAIETSQDNIENILQPEKLKNDELIINPNSISESKDIVEEEKLEKKEAVLKMIDKSTSQKEKSSFAADEINAEVTFISQENAIAKGHYNSASSDNVFYPNKGKIYAARSSNMKYEILIDEKKSNIQEKSDDLVLINGKLSDKKKKDVNSEDYESYVELKNPIYIINREEFSEESLFGDKPTSKYAPLTNQKIDSIKVYLPEEAIAIYGDKGKNGVVIISIKK